MSRSRGYLYFDLGIGLGNLLISMLFAIDQYGVLDEYLPTSIV